MVHTRKSSLILYFLLNFLINQFEFKQNENENMFGSALYTSNVLLRIVEYLAYADESKSLIKEIKIDKSKWSLLVDFCYGSDDQSKKRYLDLLNY